MNRCPNCMKIIEEKSKCPYCGHDLTSDTPDHYLNPGSILNDRYVIGRVIGQGGFGIAYIGWDQKLEIRVAIKEYYPKGYVSRITTISSKVTKIVGEDHRIIDLGKERFLKEARILAHIRDTAGVVSVQDYFEENQTAYIVMEFLSGITLKERLKSGLIDADTIIPMMLPIMDAVQKIHEQGLIHRDISPDNIIIMDDGSLKLLDFGAAKDISHSIQETRSIAVAKSGYSPPEQYFVHSELSPASDIYSIFATIYTCITGIMPEDSLERTWDDQLKWPIELGIRISDVKSDALKRGMAIKQEERFQSLEEVKAFLLKENSNTKEVDQTEHDRKMQLDPDGNNTSKQALLFKYPVQIACVLLLLAVIVLGGGKLLHNQVSLVGQKETAQEKKDDTTELDGVIASYTIDGCEYKVRSQLKNFLENGWEINKHGYNVFWFVEVGNDNPDYLMKPYEQCTFLLSKGDSKIVVVVDNNRTECQKAMNGLVSSIYLYGCYDYEEDLSCSVESCIVNNLDIYNNKSKIERTFDIQNTSTNDQVVQYIMPIQGEEITTVKHAMNKPYYDEIYEINCFKIIYNLEDKDNLIMHIDIPTEASCYYIDYDDPVLETLTIDGESISPGVDVKTLKDNGWEIVGDPNDPSWSFEQQDFIKPQEGKALIMKKGNSKIEVYLTKDFDRNIAIDKSLVSGICLFSEGGDYHVDSIEVNGAKYGSYEQIKSDPDIYYGGLYYSTANDRPYIVYDGFVCNSVRLFSDQDNIYLEFIGIGYFLDYLDEYLLLETKLSINSISINSSEYDINDSVDVFLKDGWTIREGEWNGKDKSLIDALVYADDEIQQVLEKGDSKVLISVSGDYYTNLCIDMTESKIESFKLDGVELKGAIISKVYDYLNIPFEINEIKQKGTVQFGLQDGYLTIDYDDSGKVLRIQLLSGKGVG